MEKTNFENLKVYQLAEELADKIWVIVLRWDYFAKDTVGKQMVRSADGVGANLAEGTGRGTLQDNGLLGWPAALSTRPNIGCGELTGEIF